MVLFLYTLAVAVYRAAFGQGSGPVFLDAVRCTGEDASLLSCRHGEIGRVSCSHSRDAGVLCPPC